VTRALPDDRFARLWNELLDVPEGSIGEIVAGGIHVTPRPGPPHTRAASGLGVFVGGAFGYGIGGPGGWVILDEPRVRFADDVRVPDLAGWRADRYQDPEGGPYAVVPDWICEVLSPSTTAEDRAQKQPLYARAGVRHLWLADPEARTLEVLRLEGGLWVVVSVLAGEGRVRAEPFDAIELDLGAVWRGRA